MSGLVLSEPGCDEALRGALLRRLDELMLLPCRFVEERAIFFEPMPQGEALIRRVGLALLRPDTPVPADALLSLLMTGEPRPANAIRRAMELQQLLDAYLRTDGGITDVEGAHLLGSRLLVPWVNETGLADCPLPPGTWTLLKDGTVHRERFRQMFSLMEHPVLVRQNTLLPVSLPGAAWLTLHWYESEGMAETILPDGRMISAALDEQGSALLNAPDGVKCRLALHRDGE